MSDRPTDGPIVFFNAPTVRSEYTITSFDIDVLPVRVGQSVGAAVLPVARVRADALLAVALGEPLLGAPLLALLAVALLARLR